MAGRRGARERFLTTIVMTDIVGSTEHAAELGDSGWRELIQLHHALVRDALRRHGGREIDTAGDGFFAIFDAPAEAVDCALEIAPDVAKLGIEIRAGVHVGEVEQIARKVGGISVVIAARIMAAAGANEVLVSATVRDLAAGSGLTFDDRGVRQLKGVPGEWHVYSVGRTEREAVDSGGAATASDRRAAAVRRARARPIWQRRPRLVAATALGLAIVLATGGLLLAKPWQPPALAKVTENSIGVIDPDRDEVIGEIQVGTRPGGIAVGDGYAWITNTGDDSVTQIDIATHAVVVRIDVGRAPKGIAVAEGSVWVANSGERTVSRINAATGRVVGQPIEVGNGPTAITAVGSILWVANATDSTVVSVDATTGTVGKPIGVGASPVALAADASGLWVASEDGASVSHLDAVSGVTVAAPVQLAARPSAIALDPVSVWVASTDGTVTRIDRSTGRVTATIDVGGSLAAVVADGTAIWVGDDRGIVSRLDPANPAAPPKSTSTSSAVAALAVIDDRVWLAAQASAADHRGGTLRIVDPVIPATDPLDFRSASSLLEDGLVGLRRVGGSAGSSLLPDLAVALPRPENAGRTYTFTLRPGLSYSNGEPIRPIDFRRALERSFQVLVDPGQQETIGDDFFRSIAGPDRCPVPAATEAARCDLSERILVDDATNTVTFNLAEADPDFLYKLATPYASPVPDGVPMNELSAEAFPATGPYVVAAATATELRLTRNTHFHVWDAAVRPDGFPDEIDFSMADDDASRIAMVEDGRADYTSYRADTRTSPDLFARLKTQYPGQWHVGSVDTAFVMMNSSIPPFDQVDARRAVNFAIDRGHVADLAGGPPDVAISCQILPPGWVGYQPYCPYTLHPDPGGRWQAPDLEAARRLVDSSGTRGAHVVVGPTFAQSSGPVEYLAQVLSDLGYDVSIDHETDDAKVFDAYVGGKIQIMPNGWGPDFTAPSNFFQMFTCDGDTVLNYCEADFDTAFQAALGLQTTDPSAAAAAWTALDRRAVDLGLVIPMYTEGADFVSARVGNYQYSPSGAVLFDQMWVQ